MIDIHATRFMAWMRAQEHLSILREYRESAFVIRDQLTQKALYAISRGEDVETALKRMGYELTNKLLHPPTRHLRDAAIRGDEATLQLAAALLGLKENGEA